MTLLRPKQRTCTSAKKRSLVTPGRRRTWAEPSRHQLLAIVVQLLLIMVVLAYRPKA